MRRGRHRAGLSWSAGTWSSLGILRCWFDVKLGGIWSRHDTLCLPRRRHKTPVETLDQRLRGQVRQVRPLLQFGIRNRLRRRFSRLPIWSATLSSFPARVLTRRNRTAPRGSGTLKGCADQACLADARVEELGFPGAGHGGLLRSRGELGRRKVSESYSGRLWDVKGKFPPCGSGRREPRRTRENSRS